MTLAKCLLCAYKTRIHCVLSVLVRRLRYNQNARIVRVVTGLVSQVIGSSGWVEFVVI
jgi:hypothetical protein